MDALAIIKYCCAAAAGAWAALLINGSFARRRGLAPLRPLRILITGAAGHIGYALAPLIARGQMCGPQQQVILRMHDREQAAQNLAAVQMELDDLASDLLLGTEVSHDLEEACKDVDIAVLLSGLPPRRSMEDFFAQSREMYSVIGRALNDHASQHVKVVIVPQPASAGAAAVRASAPRLAPQNITVLSRLAHNRLIQQVADPLAIHSSEVSNVIVWGNPTSTSALDVLHGTVRRGLRVVPVQNCVDDELVQIMSQAVRERTTAIVQARNLTPALSVAGAICDHFHDWLLGTPEGTWVSMGVASDGSYGVPENLYFSFPVTCRNNQWHIVQGLPVGKDLEDQLQACIQEAEKEQQH
ncbi:g842 [Coccomyxa viridis]|uniref:G842 protein n=1 Tax=Coccomyxa viridis TaxID=1274662 RepID=A0ABP1FGP3_9CHLO